VTHLFTLSKMIERKAEREVKEDGSPVPMALRISSRKEIKGKEKDNGMEIN
jgi:hypothetical protein